MDRAIRPSAAMPSTQTTGSRRLRHPQERAEIKRRVAVYASQVEKRGRITWLPRRGEGQSA